MRKHHAKTPLLLLLVLLLLLSTVFTTGCSHTLKGKDFPAVFVHGYSGWVSYDARYDTLPYFGLTAGNMLRTLERRGYDVYAASVGPISSAWDRACELYAQIMGTRVDYGASHAALCGHERYGEDYTGRALIPNFQWSDKSKLHLIGHSFGGNTIRLLEDLLADGAPEEVAAAEAADTEVSPLFTGGHGGYVFSITIIASPSNGTTAVYQSSAGTSVGANNGVYDPHLQHFGISAGDQASVEQAIAAAGFQAHHDNALEDLSVEKACDMNRTIEMQPNVFYFSYYGTRTEVSAAGISVSKANMNQHLRLLADAMGSYTGTSPGQYTVGWNSPQTVAVTPQSLDAAWQPNDGMVNAESARCPYHLDSAGNRVYDAHADYDGSASLSSAIWYIMPELDYDHFTFIGGIMNEDSNAVKQFYIDLMDRLYALRSQ